jgi:MYXO-CTERM domain-containing protein
MFFLRSPRAAAALFSAIALIACSVAGFRESPAPAPAPSAAGSSRAPGLRPAGAAEHSFKEVDGAFSRTSGRTTARVDAAGRIRLTAVGSAGPASLDLETVAAGRATPLPAQSLTPLPTTTPPDPPRLSPDGSVVLSRSAAVERIVPRPAGIEQRWEFASRPAGDGDLVLRVHPSTAAQVESSENGLRFAADPSRSAVFHYGDATWVDAAGVRSLAQTRLVDGDIEIRVPSLIVERSAYPSILAPIAGVEFELEKPLFIPSSDTAPPSIASNGTDYLVTWAGRSGIYAARVSTSGTLQQPARITVSSASGGGPRAVWDGTEWVVAWISNGGVYHARVGSDGSLLDAMPQAVSSYSAQNVDLASDGSNVFLVWSESASTYISNAYGALLTPGTGAVTTPQQLSTAAMSQATPRVVFDGIEYFVAWQDSRASTLYYSQTWDIYGARVSRAGALVDTSGIAISTATANQTVPLVASNGGGNVLIAWLDARGGVSTSAIYGARFASATGLVDGPPATGGLLLEAGPDYTPSMAFDGTQYVLAWAPPYTIIDGGYQVTVKAERVSTSGTVLGSPAVQTVAIEDGYSYGVAPAVGGSGSGSLIAWLNVAQHIYGERMDTSGTLLDGAPPGGGFLVSEEPSAKNLGAVAANGTDYLAVWTDNRSGTGFNAIYATRLDGGGTPLDSPAFPIATGRKNTPYYLAATSNGKGFAVTWVEYGTSSYAYARLINGDGSLVNGPASADGIVLTTSAWDPAVIASDGTDYLAVWPDSRGSTMSNYVHNLYAMRISSAGTVYPAMGSADGSFAVVTGSTPQYPALGFDGTNYLLTWQVPSYTNQGMGSRLTPTGQRLDGTVGTAGFSVGVAAQQPTYLAFDGTHYLAVSPAGVNIVVPPSVVATTNPGTTNVTSAIYDGASFWVFESGNGMRVRDDGTVVDTTPIADMGTYWIGAVGDGFGDFLAVYQVGSDGRGKIVIDDYKNGGSCSVGDFCASGVCEDGVCCDHACGGSTGDCQACTVAAGGAKDGVCSAAASGHVCRPGSPCELAGTCDGLSTACPPDYYLPPTTVCGAAGECTLAPLCSGTSATCDPGQPVGNGTLCGSGGHCNAGVCVGSMMDAGTDGGPKDAGADGAPKDAGAADGHTTGPDAGVDAGAEDSGAHGDAGEPGDASEPGDAADAGSSGHNDAAVTADSGAADAATSQDASPDTSAPGAGDAGGGDAEGAGSAPTTDAGGSSGCSCEAAPRKEQPVWIVGLGIALLALRRRRAANVAAAQVATRRIKD